MQESRPLPPPEQQESYNALRSFFQMDEWKGLVRRALAERQRCIEACLRSARESTGNSPYAAGIAEGIRLVTEKIPLDMLDEATKAKVTVLEEDAPSGTDPY